MEARTREFRRPVLARVRPAPNVLARNQEPGTRANAAAAELRERNEALRRRNGELADALTWALAHWQERASADELQQIEEMRRRFGIASPDDDPVAEWDR